MGYVGLPLAIEFSMGNIKVIGFDIDKSKVNYRYTQYTQAKWTKKW